METIKTSEQNMPENEGGITPPYLSQVRIARIMELASNRNLAHISSSLFQQYGFNIADANLAVNTFKFLGLADNDGNATELMSKLHLHGELKKQEFEKILREAYKKLFDATNGKAHELSKEDLKNEFAIQYGITKRIVDAAVPTFLKLCEFAGLKEQTERRSTEKKQGGGIISRIKTPTKQKVESSQHLGIKIIPIESGKAFIGIPEGYMEKSLLNTTLRDNLDTFIKAARTFADTIKEKELPSDNAGGS